MNRTRTLIVSLLTLVAAAVAVPSIQAAPACTISWTGGAGTSAWSTAANWDLARVPTGTDDVCLPGAGTVVVSGSGGAARSVQGDRTLRLESGTLTVNEPTDAVLARYEQAGGTLTGLGSLIVSGAFDWTGGSVTGSGLLKVDGTTHIHGDVLLGISRRFETRDGSWTSGRIEAHNNMLWTITGTFDMRSESGWGDYVNQNNSTVPTIRVVDGATLVKTTVSPTSDQDTSFDTDVEFAIDNDGTVRAEAGRLRFGNGSVGAAGHFASTTGELSFYGGQTFFMDGSTFDGLELSGGRLEVPTGGLFKGTRFKQSGGTVAGDGTLETTGFDWTGGSMTGSGITRDLGSAHVHPGSTAILGIGRRLETRDGTWTGAGRIEVHNRALWTSTGVLTIEAERADTTPEIDFVNQDNTASAMLHNTGTIRKTAGTGATDLQIAVDNDGTVDASSGRLALQLGGGESTGSFASTGDGRTVLADGTFTIGNGTFDGFEVAGGRVEVNGTYTGADVWQTRGTIAGAGTLDVTGTLDWTGGTMAGAGTTRSTGTADIHPGSADYVVIAIGRRLHTEDGAWRGDGRIEIHNRALWTSAGAMAVSAERADGTPELDFVNQDNTADAVLHNTGALTRSTESGTTDLDVGLDNDGTITTTSGRLRFVRGGGESTGSFASDATGRTVFGGGTFTIGSGAFDGFEVAGGRVEVNGAYTGADVWLSSGTIAGTGTLKTTGTLDWTGGTMSGAGATHSTGTTTIHPVADVTLGSGRSLQTGAGEFSGNGRMEVHNRALWTSTGDFDLRVERADGTPEIDFVNQDNTADAVLHNTGTLTKRDGSGTTDLDAKLDNDGTIAASSGRLRFVRGGGESTGSFASSGDGRTVFGGGTFTIGGGAFDGFEVAGGRVEINGAYTGADLWLSSGTVAGTGTLEVTGALDWTGGAMSGSGATHSTGTTTIHPVAPVDVTLGSGRTLQTGAGEFSGNGRMEVHNRALWTSTGEFDLRVQRADGTPEIDFVNQDNTQEPRVRNTGLLVRSAGDGDTDVDAAFENDGTIDARGGRLRLIRGGAESTGAFNGTGGGRVVLDGGTFTAGDSTFAGLQVDGGRLEVAAGATLAGTDLLHTGGTIAGAGSVEIAGTHDWSGGAITGSGTTRSANANVHPADGTAVILGSGRRWETAAGAWTSGRLEVQNRAHWENTGSFDLRSHTSHVDYVNQDNTAGPTMRNAGTLTRTKPTPETAPVNLPFEMAIDNDGAVTSDSGEISFNHGGTGTSTGTFGSVALNGGNWTLGEGATFTTGARVTGATVELSGGTRVSMPGGTIANSTIRGDGDLLVPSGELTWTGGTIGGSGLMHVAEGARLVVTSGSSHLISGRRLLQNEGELRWEGGYLYVSDAGTLLNEGTLDAITETYDISTSGLTSAGRATFVNTGTIVKREGTGETRLHWLDNHGLLDIRSGRVYAHQFRQSSRGRLLATLAGTARGTQHAGVDVSSARGFAGRVAVRLAEGYTPADGDQFQIVDGGSDQLGAFEAEPLALPDGGSLTGSVVAETGMLTYTASMPAGRAAAPVTAPSSAPAPAPAEDEAPAPPAPDAADSTVRLAPGAATAIRVADGLRVQVLTPTKRASVRFDRKARKLRVKLRRAARGKRLKLRYRVVAADGRRSRVATLTVRIARARR